MMIVVIAVILSTVATIAAAGLGLYAHGLRRQIRDICAQSEFIEKHGSNKLVSVDIRNKAVLELVSCMNGLLEEKRRVAIQAKNNERIFKDTISGISHDIRTPLTSLYGYFQMLQGAADSASKEKYTQIIHSRILELQDMTEQLFTFVKLEYTCGYTDTIHCKTIEQNLEQQIEQSFLSPQIRNTCTDTTPGMFLIQRSNLIVLIPKQFKGTERSGQQRTGYK